MRPPQWYEHKVDPTIDEWANSRISAWRTIRHLKSQGRKEELWDNVWALTISGLPQVRDGEGHEVQPKWITVARDENATLDLKGRPPRWPGLIDDDHKAVVKETETANEAVIKET